MFTLWLLGALALTGVSPDKICSYQDVINYLNLTRNNEVYTSSRPVRDWRHPTVVHLDVNLFAILAVMEKSQVFTPFIWTYVAWDNELISWDPSKFCGILQVSLPREMLWKPDLVIFEMVEEDKSPHSPFLHVSHNGTVTMDEDSIIASTCKMDVYKFPFDTQSCVITFGSIVHSVDDLHLVPVSSSAHATETSLEYIQTQGEWEFLNLSVIRTSMFYQHQEWDQVKYQITMRRRPLLYIIDFLFPILFFLTLDIASFFISDMKGEKLGFKVTVLLAISVLLLILNDILPSMSNKTPLIATYCIVIFGFMLLSLLETILVTYLMEKDSVPHERVEGSSQCEPEGHEKTLQKTCCQHECKRRRGSCGGTCGVDVEAVSQQQACGSGQLTDSQSLQLILGELQELRRNLPPYARGVRQKKPLYWERIGKRINAAFFCFYLITIFIFLLLIFIEWMA